MHAFFIGIFYPKKRTKSVQEHNMLPSEEWKNVTDTYKRTIKLIVKQIRWQEKSNHAREVTQFLKMKRMELDLI